MSARRKYIRTSLFLVSAALSTLSATAQGQSIYSWTSGGGTFSSSASWLNGAAPPSDGSAVLDFSPSGALSYSATNDLPAVPLPLAGFAFNGNSTGSVTIHTGSNNFQLVPNSAGIVQNGNVPVTFISTTGTAGSSIFDITSNFTIGGNGTGTVTIGGATTNVVFTGTGNVNVNFANLGSAANPNLVIGNIGSTGADNFTGGFNIQSGYVRAGQTGGDLFSNTTILSVAAGSTFDFNNNGENMGGLQGAGTVILGTTAAANASFFAPGDRTWSGSITGNGYIEQAVANTLFLGGSNSYTAGTTVTAGTIQLTSPTALPGNGPITLNGASTVFNMNGYSGSASGLVGTASRLSSLLLGGATLTINSTGNSTYLGAIDSNGALIKNGAGVQVLPASAMALGDGIALNGGSLQFIGNGGSYTPSTFSAAPNTGLDVNGAGMTLSGTNAFGGSSLTLTGGGLAIDDTGNNSTKLPGQPSVSLISSSLNLLGSGSGSSSETLAGTTIAGAANFSVTAGAGQTASLALGPISVFNGSAFNVTLNNATSGTASVTATLANGFTGLGPSSVYAIVGGNAVVNGSDWATVNADGTLTAVSSAAYSTGAGSNFWGPTLLNSVTASYAPSSNSATAALRFNAPAAYTVTLSGTANTITSGGILVTPNVGSFNSTISGGSLASPSGVPFYLDQYNPSGTLTISSTFTDTPVSVTGVSGTFSSGASQVTVPSTSGLTPGMTVSGVGIAANTFILAITGSNSLTLTGNATATEKGSSLTFGGGTTLVKSGPGTVVLSSAGNKFTGGLLLDQGTVNYSNNVGYLGAAVSPVVFNGGTLNFTSASTLSDTHPWIFGPSGGTVNVTQGSSTGLTKSGSNVYGFGNLTKTGSATLSIGSNASTFSGQVFVDQGTVRFTSSQIQSCAGMTVANGGQYLINDNGVGTFQFASGAVLTLNGSDANNANTGATGAFAVTVQSAPSTNPTSTFPDAIYLASDSLFTTDSTGGTSAFSTTLKLTGPISGPGNLIVGGNNLPGVVQIGNASNSYGGSSGSTTVQGGVLQLGVANGLPTSTNLVLANSNTAAEFDLNGFNQTVATLTTNGQSHNAVINSSSAAGLLTVNYPGNTPMIYQGNLGGSGLNNNNFAFAVTGAGIVVLDGTNSYTQGTTIAAGSVLQLGNLDGQGNIAGSVVNSGSLVFTFGGESISVTNSANLSGTGAVIAQGGATVALAGTNTFTGPMLVQNGTLVIPSSGTSHLPAASAIVLGDAAGDPGVVQVGDNNGPASLIISSLTTTGSGNTSGAVGGYAGGNSSLTVNVASDATYSGLLGTSISPSPAAGNLAFTKSGPARLTLTGSNGSEGPTTVNAGVLEAGSPSAFSPVSLMNVNAGATLRLSGNSVSVGNLAGAGTVENANATPALLTVVGAGNSAAVFFGVIQNGAGGGALSLYKTGTGMLTLAGNNTYTGATTVNGGTLSVAGGSTQASAFTVSNGAALAVTTSANTALLDSTLALGTSPGDAAALDFSVQGAWSPSVPMLAVSGAVTTSGTTTINLASSYLPSVGTYPLLALGGGVTGSGTSAFALGSLPSTRLQASLVDVDSMLELNVTLSDSPKWTGATGNVWDTASANWALLGSGGSTTYYQGDNVLFDDTATGPTAIALNQPVSPNSVLFSNNGLSYSVSGSGKITGLGSLTVAGTAGVTLATDNDYTGGTTISAGTLQLGSGGTTGSVVGQITDNAMLAFNRSDNPTFAGTIGGSGQVALLGSGQITLTGSNTYAGPTNITAGTLAIGAGGNTGSIVSDVIDNGVLVFGRSDNVTFANAISGSGTVTQAGPGLLVFTNNHSYSGATNISGGTLQLGSGGTSGGISSSGGVNLANNSTLVFNRADTVTYGGSIGGNGIVVQQGPGDLVLTGSNIQSFGTQFNGGTVTVSSSSSLGSTGVNGQLLFYGGALQTAAPLTLPQPVYLNAAGGTLDTDGNDVTLTGQIQGMANLVKVGGGILTLTNIYNWYANTPGQTFTVNGGAVAVDSNAQMPTTLLVLNGGTLQATNTMGTLNNPALASGTEFSTNILVGPNGATIDTGTNWFTTVSTVTGSAGTTLNKIGSGTWYVRYGLGGSGYNGNVNIVAGTLLDDYTGLGGGNADAFGNSTVVNIAAGATWDDSWGNGESMGGIAGAGTILLPVGDGISLQANVATTFSGVIHSGSQSIAIAGGNSPFTQGSGGSITLTSTASDFGGQTTIDNGTIVVSASVLNNVNGPLGNANSEILVGNNSGNNNASLFSDTPGVEIGRDIRLQSGNTGVSTIGGLNTSGTVTYSGGVYLGTNASATRPLEASVAAGGTVDITGSIQRPVSATGSSDRLDMIGPGTLVLSGSNNYDGGTFVTAGTLIATNNEALADGSSLTVGDAALFGSILPAADSAAVAAGSSEGGAAIAPVPEPGTLALLGFAAAYAVLGTRRRERTNR